MSAHELRITSKGKSTIADCTGCIWAWCGTGATEENRATMARRAFAAHHGAQR